MTTQDRATHSAAYLAWGHAVLFGAIALACYFSPETVFGSSAWLPLARLAIFLFAAALMASAITLVGSARSGSLKQIRLALLAAMTIDAQVPIPAFSASQSRALGARSRHPLVHRSAAAHRQRPRPIPRSP